MVKLSLLGDDYQRIISLETSANGTNGYGLFVRTNGSISNASNNDPMYSATGAVTADTWTYLTATADGTDKKIYVNGLEVKTASNTNVGAATTANLFIGKSSAIADREANGVVDAAKVYNAALSATEVLQNYNATKRDHKN